MRTTLTLDPDVAAAIKRLRRARKETLRKLINEALRRGLKQISGPEPRQPFRTESVDLGELRVSGIDNIAEVLQITEISAFKRH